MAGNYLDRMTAATKSYVQLIPCPAGAFVTAALDEEPPEFSVLSRGTTIHWRVEPDRSEFAKVDGQSLRDFTGTVGLYLSVDAEGRARYNQAARLGVMSWQQGSYFIGLAVSAPLFERVLDWCKAGRIPTLKLDVGLMADNVTPETNYETLGGSSLEWDTAKFHALEVRWFQFQLPLNLAENASPDEVFESQPVSAKLFAQATSKVRDDLRNVTYALWLVCGLLVLSLLR